MRAVTLFRNVPELRLTAAAGAAAAAAGTGPASYSVARPLATEWRRAPAGAKLEVSTLRRYSDSRGFPLINVRVLSSGCPVLPRRPPARRGPFPPPCRQGSFKLAACEVRVATALASALTTARHLRWIWHWEWAQPGAWHEESAPPGLGRAATGTGTGTERSGAPARSARGLQLEV